MDGLSKQDVGRNRKVRNRLCELPQKGSRWEGDHLRGIMDKTENDGTIVVISVIASLAIGAAAVMWKLFDQKRK